MPRQATGEKRWSKQQDTFMGRIRKGEWRSLGTRDPVLADERLAAWAKSGVPPAASRGREPFRSAAERIMARQAADGFKGAGGRRHRIRAFALPVLGHIEVGAITAANVKSVLKSTGKVRDAIAAEARARGAKVVAAERGLDAGTLARWALVEHGEAFMLDTVAHLRTDVSRILGALLDEEELEQNVALGVELPDTLTIDERPRMVLSDEQYVQYMRRGFEGEVEMVALLSRAFAGGRPSDWFEWRYGDIDFERWTAFVRRPKTDGDEPKARRRGRRRRATLVYERVQLGVPEICREPLCAWRARAEAAGRATPDDLVFPVQKGERVGQKKKRGMSLAERFRQTVWEERIHVWMDWLPGFAQAKGDDRKRFDKLQVDTEETRALDFYSHRRAFIGAMARAGVNQQTAMLAAGHSSPITHQGYMPGGSVVELPAAVVPGGGLPQAFSGPQGSPQAPTPAPSVVNPVTLIAQAFALLGAQLGANTPFAPSLGVFAPAGALDSGANGVQLPDFARYAHLGSNQGPSAPEAPAEGGSASANAHLDALVRALPSPSEPRLPQALGNSNDPPRDDSNVVPLAKARSRRR